MADREIQTYAQSKRPLDKNQSYFASQVLTKHTFKSDEKKEVITCRGTLLSCKGSLKKYIYPDLNAI